MPYTFLPVKNMVMLTGRSYDLIESFADHGNQFSLICGKIQALSGGPIYKTEDLDDLFSYCILATSEEGEEIYLNVYCAGSVPAAGGKRDKRARKAGQGFWKRNLWNSKHVLRKTTVITAEDRQKGVRAWTA